MGFCYGSSTERHSTCSSVLKVVRFRLDEEQYNRMADKKTEGRIKFKLEGGSFKLVFGVTLATLSTSVSAHIFLDDAWEDDPEFGRVPNQYFRLLFDILMHLTR